MSRPQRPRLADVARLAGVSTAAASKVINDRQGSTIRVTPETAQRVWSAVRQLGFVPNPVARSLADGRNRILGVFTHEAIFPLDQRNFYHPFLLGIEQEAEERRYDLLLFTNTRAETGTRRIYRDGVNRLQLADGAVLLGREEAKDEIHQLIREGYPFVYIGRREVGERPIWYVAADYTAATRTVIEHLYAFGHHRIMNLGSLQEREATIDRRRGYEMAHRRLGLPLDPNLSQRLQPEQLSCGLLRSWLDAGITALVVEDDILAQPLLELAQRTGLRIPRDFSLAVLGDPLVYTEATPDWTTFRIPREQMGREAVRLLIERLEGRTGDPPSQVTLPCRFVPGSTTGPAPEATPTPQP